MTLRHKIGQMLHCGFHGYEPGEDIARLIRERHIGGVILFARNVRDVRQVAAMNAEFQRIALEAGVPPLTIAIDQEGGMVARLTDGVALMPGNMAIAAGGEPQAAYEAARVTGEELRALGINLNYAPVLDVNVNPGNPVIGVRSYGESPELVGEYGVRAIRGLQEAGVTATAKHFPGHGDTDVDSHLDLPTIAHGRERIYGIELAPFVRAIEEGIDAIMSSHIYFPSFETEKRPVTLSRNVLTGLLREELGFDGVIMTDCMEMKAIADHYGTVAAAVLAVEAGADCVLISHRHDLQEEAIEALVAAVESGRLSEARIDESVERLLAMKRKRGVTADAVTTAADEAYYAGEAFRSVGSREHRETARRISEASVTLVKADAGTLPLRRERTLVIGVQAVAVSEVDESVDLPVTLGQAIAAHGVEVEERTVALDQVGANAEELIRLAVQGGFRQVVIGTYNASFRPDQSALVRAILDAGVTPVVVALRNPYDIKAFPDVSAYLATYESRPLALQSAAKVLTGVIGAKGRTPVTIHPDYPVGWGGTFQ
ncbi:beta-N-acetylhexosaminidase [Paenibacillus hemerocallicola]|uniref:Beta-N-acetylhexosaminidase n=2 Tax=Paenibacillus hemerocallicola TaxID=1172614 RepID=A0A5C4TCB5_9BACL|nr:beta-N-acetylhexosaminidase [Paenibacillus hemerocallicola]TNJ66744.1 beta-N-acetylhexosaminidase [Paenibacillus hemerocallicola]